ncbi:MAG: fumarylacetoacetate hydrolase family protein [Bacteroidales bacterium]|nr:fumarylacetoacetate hydrolase family protein [Bacteroidales bacterium]MCL2133773.1 fumarylacetoacetate hydrolase family protein [Bacteroidales bacterium]
MKLICICNTAEEATFYLRPDTALLRNNQPFYYPDFTRELYGELCLAFRVCRLGRSIDERFANRYLDAVGLSLLLTAADIRRRCMEQALPCAAAVSFDYSAALSPEFIPLNTVSEWNYQLKADNTEIPLLPFDFGRLTKVIIPMVSQFLTLKIGDYIFMPVSSEFSLQQGQTITAFLENHKFLHVEIR